MMKWKTIGLRQGLIAATLLSLAALGVPALASNPEQANLLYIGDSHTAGRFGAGLDKKLRTLEDAKVLSYGSCGSSPHSWYNGWTTTCGWVERKVGGSVRSLKSAATPRFEGLLEENKPQVVVIALGANLMGASLDTARKTTQRMVDSVKKSGALCVWVGPPQGRNKTEPKFTQLVEALAATVQGTCEFVDSRPITHYPETGGDGVHFDGLPVAVRDEILGQWTSGILPVVETVWKKRPLEP
jgi:hypothetical protein